MYQQPYPQQQQQMPYPPSAAFAVGRSSTGALGAFTVDSTGVGLLLLGLTAAASWVVGAAIAPAGKRNMYGLIGMPVGILTGVPGMAVMALIATGGRVLKK